MILHYSLAILNTNDNALSLLFFANAPMSDSKVRGKQEFIMRRVKIRETDSGVNSSSHSLEIFTSDFGDEDGKSLSGLSVSKT